MGSFFSLCCPNSINYKKASYDTNRKLIRVYINSVKPEYERAADIYIWMISQPFVHINNGKYYNSYNILDRHEYWLIGCYYYDKMKSININESSTDADRIVFNTCVIRAKYFLSKVASSIEIDSYDKIEDEYVQLMLEEIKKYY